MRTKQVWSIKKTNRNKDQHRRHCPRCWSFGSIQDIKTIVFYFFGYDITLTRIITLKAYTSMENNQTREERKLKNERWMKDDIAVTTTRSGGVNGYVVNVVEILNVILYSIC